LTYAPDKEVHEGITGSGVMRKGIDFVCMYNFFHTNTESFIPKYGPEKVHEGIRCMREREGVGNIPIIDFLCMYV